MKPWRTMERETVVSCPPWLDLERHAVELSDGTRVADWMWVKLPDFINLAAVDSGGKFLCFRQTKYAVPGVTLAVPGGYVDPGETPEAAARRELEEETGYGSTDIRSLGSFMMDGNRGCGRGHLFLAKGCEPRGTPAQDDLEQQELIRLTPREIQKALLNGEFGVASWTATLALALLALGES